MSTKSTSITTVKIITDALFQDYQSTDKCAYIPNRQKNTTLLRDLQFYDLSGGHHLFLKTKVEHDIEMLSSLERSFSNIRLARSLAFVTFVASACAEEIKVPGGVIDVQLGGSHSVAWRNVALKWVEISARSVATYYGKFPVALTRLRIASCPGSRPRGGRTFGSRGPLITISLGRDATVIGLEDDWLLTHEMIHLALPSLAEEHHWLEEGLATYVEPTRVPAQAS